MDLRLHPNTQPPQVTSKRQTLAIALILGAFFSRLAGAKGGGQ